MSILGDIYNIWKDFRAWHKERNTYKEEIKYVNMYDFSKSDRKNQLEQNGYHLCWVKEHKIELKKEEGYVVIEEIDEKNRIKYTFKVKRNPEQVLMGKKDQS